MKRHKVKLTPSELSEHLEEQVGFLRGSCRRFDEGDEAETKRIAAVLRILLHDTAQSRSLLGQLGTRFGWRFADSAYPYVEQNLLTHHGLAAVKLNNTPPIPSAKVVPRCEPEERFHPFLPFRAWWSAVVFKDKPGGTLSRRDVVLTMANQDGGAHVDPELDEGYSGLAKGNTLGYTFSVGGVDVRFPTNPVPASIRQIAYEVLVTLEASQLVERKPERVRDEPSSEGAA